MIIFDKARKYLSCPYNRMDILIGSGCYVAGIIFGLIAIRLIMRAAETLW